MPALTRRWTFAFALCLGAAGALAATGSGTPATEDREASGFATIQLRGDMNLVVRQAAHEGVRVTADDNLLPLLQTTVEGSGDERSLRIQWKPGEWVRSRTRTVVTVDVVRLGAVSSSGSGDILIEALKTPALSLSISGSSDARLKQLDAASLGIRIAGSGDVRAEGAARRLNIAIAGSGDVHARELAADDVDISIAGSGDASVRANKTLAVSIAGSGDVEYVGTATLTKSRIAGSGTLRQRSP